MTDTLVAVVDRDPDWTELSVDVPPIVGRLLRRCLAKDVRQRVQHIGDARLELEDAEITAHERPVRTRRPLRTLAVVAGASGLVAVAAGLVYTLDGRRTGAPADRHIARLTLKLDGETSSDLSLVVDGFFIPFALSPDGELIPEDWSPDGRSLLFSEYTDHGDTNVWIYSGGKATPLLASSFNEASAKFSPDGRFIAFDADDGGVNHVYVQPFPAGPRTNISIEGGSSPQWTADGHQLLYNTGSRMMVVDVQTHPTLRVGQPRLLFKEEPFPWKTIAVAPDGRGLMRSPRSLEGPLELRVILNWFEELERLAPHPQR